MALPNRQQFTNLRENFSNAVRGSRVDGRQLQAAPSAQQAVPQAVPQQQAPTMSPELQRIQSMINSYQLRLNSDSFLSNLRQQQQQLQSTIRQRQGSYLNSIQQFFNTAPPELRQFLTSPQVMQNMTTAYVNSQPEFRQIQNLNQQQSQYIKTNYGEEERRLQELQRQAAPQIEQYQNQMRLFNQQNVRSLQGQTPPTVRNEYDYLPEGLTQEEFMRQARMNMDQMYRTPEQMREYFKPFYDSYLKEKATTRQIQPVQQPIVNPIVDPSRPTTTGPKPVTPTEQQPVNPTVDPIRTGTFDHLTFRPPTVTQQPPARPSGVAPGKTPDPKREIKTITPVVKPQRNDPIVDPIVTPTFKPPKVIQQRNDPIVDPKREMTIANPAVQKPKFAGHSGSNDPTGGLPALKAPGLGSKPKKQRRPSGFQQSPYKGIDTNVRGLMR